MSNSGSYAPVTYEDCITDSDPESQLQQGLAGPITAGQVVPAPTSVVPIMQVVAPATLPEGYEFMAAIGDRTVKVVVPPGGVEQGQKFEAPFPQHLEVMTGVSVPVGRWRDDLHDVYRYGVCHPHCWAGCFCHLLAAGQVISRLKLTWYGRPGTASQAAVAFKIVSAAVALYYALYIGLSFLLIFLSTEKAPSSTVFWIEKLVHYIYWITTAIVLTNLRSYVRSKYAIRGHVLEDCCCSCWCPCLVAPQMLRHTTDYDVYPATCCTETGLPPHAPSIV